MLFAITFIALLGDPSLSHDPNISQIDTPTGTPWVYLGNACYEDGIGAKAMLPSLGATDRMVISNCEFEDIGPRHARVTIIARSRIAQACSMQIIGWHNEQGLLIGIQPEIRIFTQQFTRWEYVLPRTFGPDTYTDPDFGFVIRAASMTIDGSLSGIEVDLFQITME